MERLSDQTFHDLLFGTGETMIKDGMKVHPMIIAVMPNGRHQPMMLEFGNPEEKRKVLKMTRDYMLKKHVQVYGFLMEAWFTENKVGDPYVQPSKSDRRKEAVVVMVCDANGARIGSMTEIQRDGKRSWLGTPQIMNADKNEMLEGAFVELLKED